MWDLASLSFATEVFQPSLTFFPGNAYTMDEQTLGVETRTIGISENSLSDEVARAELVRRIMGGLIETTSQNMIEYYVVSLNYLNVLGDLLIDPLAKNASQKA